ncbi:cellobiose phosphorylase [Kaistia dalseonensis]|uniref:Cellobiose phosphorylase n=1 Tax=Kaistia dalseonensis TaxID=410840 RepID=A0ABU0H2A1_9HYPH|nr:cellobiose phosphorylase [Kaistia dalseonensis]MCX5493867.1 cellobiose phosphorylase [Kaistia dalseonensis]MDQ0436433.1 cellobiose phosphorylase [Kaistia dalseonensis]
MPHEMPRIIHTPREDDLGLRTISNAAGLTVSLLPNGAILSIEHRSASGRMMINQIAGSPIDGGIGRIMLRVAGAPPLAVPIAGAAAKARIGVGARSIAWDGETDGIGHRVTLALHPSEPAWFWTVALVNTRAAAAACDIVFVQDVGLGPRGFLMGSEAYASQYLDHHIASHPDFGPVVMTRQNLRQGDCNPWLAQGCVDGAVAYATDAIQYFGPSYRDEAESAAAAFGTALPGERLQHEVACPMLQSRVVELAPGASTNCRFFGLYVANHPEASSEADLQRLASIADWAVAPIEDDLAFQPPARSLLQDAPPLSVRSLDEATIDRLYPDRRREERIDRVLWSFFVPDGAQNRHVVLRDKEHVVARRHGALVRSGQGMTLDENTLCATCWMHGVFAAQLTIGNTSFHKLFSVSRDPYNITRASGLRILVDAGDGWRLLTVPSIFEIGLSDCRWIYADDERTITIRAIAAGDAAAMNWTVDVEGEPCRFLVIGHVVLGERELEQVGSIEIDEATKRFSFRPGPDWLWGQRYPNAAYHLVTDTPDAIEAIGDDALLFEDGLSRRTGHIVIRSGWTTRLSFSVVGSMMDVEQGQRLAAHFAQRVDPATLLDPARRYWSHVTRDLRLTGPGPDVEAHSLILPWLAHDAMIHLTVPHGLEQYTGAAWGTRDVCQGPIEFLLALRHDATARAIITTIFAEQYETRGDWPQWFMLDPYANIRAGESHGDVVIWPLKALCDYVEATGDLSILDAAVPYRQDASLAPTDQAFAIHEHLDRLIATVRSRFIAGTHLIRYGEGDWNDSLQPHDPALRDWMVSSWTVALLYEQLVRYGAIQRIAGRPGSADELDGLAAAMRADFNRHLIRDGVVAGYAIFDPESDDVELLLHPSDTRTGLRYSLIPMTQAIIGGLFTAEQATHHLGLIRDHLLFPDGARLIDRPVTYRGGPEQIFRRAESSSFFGREIGLMYVHAHLRYAEALALHGDADALWQALAIVNPIAVTDHLPNASPRQRNSYFSSSDAAFADRYQASADWDRVKAGTIAVDGGWRIYSSGPGLFTRALIEKLLGIRRHFGAPADAPLLPRSAAGTTVLMVMDGEAIVRRH